MPGSVLVSGARTPIGKLLGSLGGFQAVDLGGVAIEAALSRAGISGDQVDYVIMGQVLQAGAGQIPARQAAVKGGIPMTVPALTVNKVCLSGLDAIALADQLIGAGEFDVVIAGGMESMTNAPHLLPGARAGYKYGNGTLLDSMAHDGLFCAFDQVAMGESTERYNAELGIGREEQDEFSARSHELAAAAQKNGAFDDEIVPVPIPQRKGDPVLVTEDEGVRPGTTAETLAKLRPAFAADGTITAGSASQISDGACAVVVMSRAKAEEVGATVLAEVGRHVLVARAREGDARAVARLISLVENASPALRDAMAALMPYVGNAWVIGLTGAPGVGKSTSTAMLVSAFRAAGKRIGVLAVDPSSPFSGGALLGDRVRMQEHALDDGVYIRSMASRGHLGGLSWSTPQALRVLDAAGCDVVLVETVGVGQAEVEVASLADTTVVLVAPGMGDAIQAAKAGILEVADVFVVNKADREGADATARDLRHMLSLGERRDPESWQPPIIKTVMSRGEGVDDVVAALDAHHEWLQQS